MSRTVNKITIVCYDITSNRLRNKIDKCMKDFGVRIQFSVFLCFLDSEGVARCRAKLLNILNEFINEKKSGDSLILFERLNSDSADCLLGVGIERNMAAFSIC